ncbi:MAG: hypothetical protein COA45_06955 [Zetaproteobacteria bacterium]|nr:MAG: hypothetical protein COA45_06955 [Zetaproteobacteria bacterium]
MQVKKLEEVAYLAGRIGWKGLTAKEYTEKGPLFLSVHGLNYGDYVDFQDAFHISQERYDESPEIMLQEEDILLCKDGAGIGKLGMIDHLPSPASINSSLLLIRALEGVFPKYLYYSLCSPLFQRIVQERIDGATTPHLYQREIKQLEIPLPSLEEQKRIVAILDEAFAGIDKAIVNTERNLQNARELFKSYLNNIFTQKGEGWEEKKLGELGKITSSKRIYKNEYKESGVPFYRTKEIKELANGKELTIELFIAEDRYQEIYDKFGVPVAGDILMTAIGTIGEIYVVQENDKFYFKDANVLWLKEFNDVDPNFLKFALRSFVEGLQRMSHGSTYNALPIEKLKKHVLSVPKKTEQLDRVKNLIHLQDNVKKLEVIHQQKLSALKELKQSLLQKAFVGELTSDIQEAA